jgi:signal transduction histidine kinase
LTKRAAAEREKLKNNFALLKRLHPAVSREKDIIAAIDGAIDELDTVLIRANEAADAAQAAREQLVHLAGLGLMVEMLAHELNRSTQFALGALSDARDGPALPARTQAPLATLELQLKTLSKRLRTLDPATTSGRQRKETFDLIALIHEICAGHEGEFKRHGITCVVVPEEDTEHLMVKMVKGMVVQVVENLVSNSLYWLKAHAKITDNFRPRIDLEVDSDKMELRITDNGPGVTESIKPRLFTPFFTTKPAGQGKGLGLFISRDIAKYHDCTLKLSEAHRVRKDRYNTFVFGLPTD